MHTHIYICVCVYIYIYLTCSADVERNQSRAEGSSSQQVAAPPNERSATDNAIPTVINVHIRKLNFTKRMSNKAINFIFGSSGCNFSLRSLGSRNTATRQAPGPSGGLGGGAGPRTTAFHTYFPKAHRKGCSLLLSSLSAQHSLPFDVKEKSAA